MTDYDASLAEAEATLTSLGMGIDVSVRGEPYLLAVLALAKRARSLFRGFAQLHSTDAAVAGFILLRPAVDINLVLRFLAQDPALHTSLWEAEGELETLKLIREVEADAELLAKMEWWDFPADVKRERRQMVELVRAAGIAAGVKGVSRAEGGRVFPSTHTIARVHGDLATREGYTLGYRSLSQLIHSSSRAFDDGAFQQQASGLVSFSELGEPERTIRRHRSLNVTTFASTLTLVSEPLELDVRETAEKVRSLFVSGRLESGD